MNKSKLTKHEGMLLKFIKDIWGSLTLINERLDKIENEIKLLKSALTAEPNNRIDYEKIGLKDV